VETSFYRDGERKSSTTLLEVLWPSKAGPAVIGVSRDLSTGSSPTLSLGSFGYNSIFQVAAKPETFGNQLLASTQT
jgi:hypothetical protein